MKDFLPLLSLKQTATINAFLLDKSCTKLKNKKGKGNKLNPNVRDLCIITKHNHLGILFQVNKLLCDLTSHRLAVKYMV